MSTLLDGKGGGRGEAAQLTGNNPGAVAEAMQKATAFAQSKLGLADLAASTAKLGFV